MRRGPMCRPRSPTGECPGRLGSGARASPRGWKLCRFCGAFDAINLALPREKAAQRKTRAAAACVAVQWHGATGRSTAPWRHLRLCIAMGPSLCCVTVFATCMEYAQLHAYARAEVSAARHIRHRVCLTRLPLRLAASDVEANIAKYVRILKRLKSVQS
jgi:hypothetical protein